MSVCPYRHSVSLSSGCLCSHFSIHSFIYPAVHPVIQPPD
ncbi:hypothetical protein AC239_09290 [Bacteroides fragilis]|nr:hypothetical protein AC141_21220 [Bacteroides fragilis]OCR43317.1 hypothetical protein AC239_09290 [Bacteroides fragilis]